MKPHENNGSDNYQELLCLTVQADEAGQFDQDRSDEMATPLEMLIGAGMNRSQVQDWIDKGWFIHFQDRSRAIDQDRKLGRCGQQTLGSHSHLALTPLGFRVVRSRLDRADPGIAIDGRVAINDRQPIWDPASGTLFLNEEVVRKYARQAPCQIAILAAFESAGWLVELPNPITTDIATDCCEGLRDAVKALNRSLADSSLRFGISQRYDSVHWRRTDGV